MPQERQAAAPSRGNPLTPAGPEFEAGQPAPDVAAARAAAR